MTRDRHFPPLSVHPFPELMLYRLAEKENCASVPVDRLYLQAIYTQTGHDRTPP
jgi:hypothetical protein